MFEKILREIIIDTLQKHVPGLVRDAVKKEVGPKMLTTSQVEEQYGISRQKQYRLRNNGTLTYVQNGKVITYPTETVNQYVNDHLISGKY